MANCETVYNVPGPMGPQGNTGPPGPTGPAGADGINGTNGTDGIAGPVGGDLKGTFPNPKILVANNKGEIPIGNATDTAAFSPGVNGERLVYDSTQPQGVRSAKVDLSSAAEVTNALAVSNGGTGSANAGAARTALGLGTSATHPVGDFLVAANNLSDVPNPATARTNLGISATALDYILVQDQKGGGTAGGTFLSGAWRTRDLNTEVSDAGNHASIAANQITLGAGTYRFRARCPAYRVLAHQCRLFNITAGTVVSFGPGDSSGAGAINNSIATVVGRFTIGISSVFELQHQCNTSEVADGYGIAGVFGTNEIYSEIEFWKE